MMKKKTVKTLLSKKKSLPKKGIALLELLLVLQLLAGVVSIVFMGMVNMIKSINTTNQRLQSKFYSNYVLAYIEKKAHAADKMLYWKIPINGNQNYTNSINIFFREIRPPDQNSFLPNIRWICFSFLQRDESNNETGHLRMFMTNERTINDDNENVGNVNWEQVWEDEGLIDIEVISDPTNPILTAYHQGYFYLEMKFPIVKVFNVANTDPFAISKNFIQSAHLEQLTNISEVPGDTSFIFDVN